MDMKECKYCKSIINKEATHCPHCTKKVGLTYWDIFKLSLITVLILAFLFMI